MRLTLEHLSAIAGGTMTADRRSNMNSILAGLDAMGVVTGLDRAHRLAHYLAQLAHESGRFVYDRETWGPTPAQKRYEGRADLGNTEPGDGSKFRGHTAGQITGRANTESFRDWCRDQGLPAPDFVETPSLMNTDPWEGIGPIWYWSTRNLNRYADANDIEMVTRRINGGLNGYADRLKMYERSALVLLGRKLEAGAVKRFQADHGLIADDIVGPATRAALHKALTAIKDEVAPAPVEVPDAAPEPPVVQPAPAAPLTASQYITIAETALAGLREHYGA
jgi:putative chitinase